MIMRKYTLALLTLLAFIFLTAQQCTFQQRFPQDDLAINCGAVGDILCLEDGTAYRCEGPRLGPFSLVPLEGYCTVEGNYIPPTSSNIPPPSSDVSPPTIPSPEPLPQPPIVTPFVGSYSLVSLDNILDTPLITDEVFFEKSGEEILTVATHARFDAASHTLITEDNFAMDFVVLLQPDRYVLEIEAKSDQGKNSYWATVDGNNIGHAAWGFVLSTTNFEKTQEPFSVTTSGAHQFHITLRGTAGSQIKKISVYKQSIDTTKVPSPLRQEKLEQIMQMPHPRLFLTPEKIQSLTLQYQNPTSKLHQFYHLPKPLYQGGPGGPMGYYVLKDQALAYLLTRDATRLSRIKEWLLLATQVSPEQVGYDLYAAFFLDGLATTYDWLYADLDENLRVTVRERIKAQLRYIVHVSYVGRIGSVHYGRFDHYQQGHYILPHYALAVGAAAIYLDDPDPEIKEWLLWSWDRFERMVLTSVPSAFQDGPNYMDSSREWVYKYVDLYEDFTGQSIPRLDASLQGLSEVRLHFILPNFKTTVNFDDTPPMRQLPPVWAFLWEAKRYQDPVVQGFAERLAQLPEPTDVPLYGKQRAQAALWLDETLVAQPFQPEQHLAYYNPEMEVAITRSSWQEDATLVSFVSQPYGGHFLAELSEQFGEGVLSSPHAQPHQNHFILYSHGEILAFDPGYTMEKRTRDENTILIDGHGQYNDGIRWMTPSPGRAHITRFVRKNDVTIMTGDASTAYPSDLGLQKFDRTIVVVGDELVVVYDELVSSTPRVYSWLFHHQGDLLAKQGRWKISKGDAQVILVPLLPINFVMQSSQYTPAYREGDTPPTPLVNVFQLDSPRSANIKFLVPMILSEKNAVVSFVEDVSLPAISDYAASQAIRFRDVVVAFNQGAVGETMRVQLPNGEIMETSLRVVVAQLKYAPQGVDVVITTEED